MFLKLKVIEVDPSLKCIAVPDTVIHFEGEPIKHNNEEEVFNKICYDCPLI